MKSLEDLFQIVGYCTCALAVLLGGAALCHALGIVVA
jgi:hypothetical protein